MHRIFTSTLTLAVAALIAIPAAAQDTPFSPKAADPGTLIKRAEFGQPPFAFEYTPVSQRQVVNGQRYDFEYVFDVDFDEFTQKYSDAYHNGTVAMLLEKHAFANIREPKLLVIGLATLPNGARRFMLGNRYLPFQLSFDARPQGAQTVVTIRNSILSLLHAGIMPARVGYKPADGGEIPFRWN